jgi:signal transduction histidine kinase
VGINRDRLGRVLSSYAGLAVSLILILARVLMAMIIYDHIRASANILGFVFLYLWISWAAITTIAVLFAQPLLRSTIKLALSIDIAAISISIFFFEGIESASIAFAFCALSNALSNRLKLKYVLFTFVVPTVSWIMRDAVAIFGSSTAIFPDTSANWAGVSALSLQILAASTLLIVASRWIQMDSFGRVLADLKMHLPVRSSDFDIQQLIDSLATLYAPEKAVCVLGSKTKTLAFRYYQKDAEHWDTQNQQEKLLDSLRALPSHWILIDCELNRGFEPGSNKHRDLNEAEMQLGKSLKRAGMSRAFIQPIDLGLWRGGIIFALQLPITAVLLAELSYIGVQIKSVADFVSNKASAERQFIADAHDVARRDLHDGVLQSLAALRMRLLTITKRKELIDNPVQLEIRKTVDILTLEQARLRGLLEVSENEEKTTNLITQIDVCLRGISLQWEIDVQLKSEEPAIPVDQESARNIEHLLREVLANAARHSKSKALLVMLSLNHDALMLVIKDVSPVATKAQNPAKPSLPLKSESLRHRLRLVNGVAYADGLEQGALLAINIPMQQVEDA